MNQQKERSEVLERIRNAAVLLNQPIDSRLVPDMGISFGYAVSGARDGDGIAAVLGGLFGSHDSEDRLSAPSAFGADGRISQVILTVMKFNPVLRSAATLRYLHGAVPVLEGMFLECCMFDRVRASAGISSMDWGVASCCRDGVPDVIYNPGIAEEEGLIRIIGEHPDGVANNIIILSDRIEHMEL